MPHHFTGYEPESEPQPAAARGGGRPPRKRIGVDELEPAMPSEAPVVSRWPRILAMIVFAALAAVFIAAVLGLL